MKVEQRQWSARDGWLPKNDAALAEEAQLLLVFGAPAAITNADALDEIRNAYPKAHLCGCSTAGEILDVHVLDDSLVATAVYFEHSRLELAKVELDGPEESYCTGEKLARSLPKEGLVHVLILSDGGHVNGSELVKALSANLPANVAVTGGLAGDGARFKQTFVCLDSAPQEKIVAAIGFYGDRLKVGYGSLGGWDQFGPERLITRSKGNVLYEMDGQPALELYKRYLREHAAQLPASAFLFPLSLRGEEGRPGVVRTVLGVHEEDGSLSFAGDMPEGSYVRLMRGNFDHLVDGATVAARNSLDVGGGEPPDLALLISCVGRKLVLNQRTEEEVETVRQIFGEGTALTGFYSYGEISPFAPLSPCELHNQTMSVTTFAER